MSPLSESDFRTLFTSLPAEEALKRLAAAAGLRHHTLSNSNEPPEESDVASVHFVQSETDAHLAGLNQEITKLRNQLRQLEEERTSLLSYRTRSAAVLSPLRRMPPEVLGEIFTWTLPSIGDECSRGRLDLAASPWVLTQISKKWRAAALSNPSLWSRVVLDYSSAHDHSSAYPLSVLETQIQRSRKLKIHFYGFPRESNDHRFQIQTFQLLSQHSPRWEELSLGLSRHVLPYLSPLRNRLSALKRLWIQWDDPEPQTTVQSIDCFQTASALEDVAINTDHHFLPIALSIHQFHQLTRYQFDGPWDRHKSIMEMAPNLVEAHVVVLDGFTREPWAEHVSLLHLRRLYVQPPVILDYLRFPALEELGLGLSEETASSFLPSLHSLIDRSSCVLRRVCLEGDPEAHTTTQMLQQVSSVTELVIITHPNAREKVNSLMATLTISRSTAVAPHLRLLFFACHSSVDYPGFLQLLRSRKNIGLKSAALAVHQAPQPDSATLDGLDALRREGLHIWLGEGLEADRAHAAWLYEATWN